MLVTKRGQMIIMHIILLQSETRPSEQVSKSRNEAQVLPIMIFLSSYKNNSARVGGFLTMTCLLHSV